jgi:hypothetical protein
MKKVTALGKAMLTKDLPSGTVDASFAEVTGLIEAARGRGLSGSQFRTRLALLADWSVYQQQAGIV